MNGSTPRRRRQQLRSVCDRVEHFPWQLDRRRSPPDEASDVGQHVGEENVIAAKNIALADPAAVERGKMAGRDVVDMREVEPCFHKGRHTTRCRLDNDTAGRRRPHVARTDRRRRVDDDRRQSIALDHRLDQTLSRDLAALVGADPLAFGERTILCRGARPR